MADSMLSGISSQAQDIAEAQGVTAFQASDNKYDAGATGQDIQNNVDFSGNYVDPEKSTVAGQLTSLLSSDSKYIKEAERRGVASAAQRGLLSSSISAGASTREAIAAASPIAMQDASTYAQSQLDTQRALQGMETAKGSAIIEGGLQKQTQDFTAGQNELNRVHEQVIQEKNLANQVALQEGQQAWQADQNVIQNTWASNEALKGRLQEKEVAALQNSYNVGMENLKNTQETMITNLNLTAEKSSEIRAASNQIMANYQQNVVSLLSDPTFLELSGADMNRTLENMRVMAYNQVNFVGNMSQVNLSQYLSAAFPSYTY